jgi:hypothetical protein
MKYWSKKMKNYNIRTVSLVILLLMVSLQACYGTGAERQVGEEGGVIKGGVYCDANENCECDDREKGLSEIAINLYMDRCETEYLYKTTQTDFDGEFSFYDLPAGKYCVMPDFTTVCGGFQPTTSIRRDIQLEPGEDEIVEWFGYTQPTSDGS